MTPDRQKIIDALAAAGVGVHPSTPATVTPGQAWVAWAQTTYPQNRWAPWRQWFVFLALSAGSEAASVDDGDALHDVVADALWDIGQVSTVEPWTMPVEPGQQPVPLLRFTFEM